MKLAPLKTRPDQAIEQGYVFLKCTSHRARDGLPAKGAQSYWSMRRDTYHGVYAAKDFEDLPRGITRLRGPFDDLLMCWGSE